MPILWTGNSRGLELKGFLPPIVLGFLSTSFQIILLREAECVFSGNELIYGFVLAFWLMGSSLGSFLADRKFLVRMSPEKFYALSMLSFAVSLVSIRFSRFAFNLLPSETVGLTPALLTSLFTALLVSLPLGALFVHNVIWQKGNLVDTYMAECLGSVIGGLAVSLVLIPLLPGWPSAAVVMFISGLVLSFSLKNFQKIFILLISFMIGTVIIRLDIPTEKIYWKPLNFITALDSPFFRIKIIKTEEQFSFYTNNVLAFNFPDLEVAEQVIHFPMLQKPTARKVLMIGGGFNGSLQELLKYPETNVEYVELDAGLIKLARDYLPTGGIFSHGLLSVKAMDGRKFLKEQKRALYDVIICQLPEPVSLQLNRFYTVEFFSLVKSRLQPGGIFSFSVPASENYISDELADFLASLYNSLVQVFGEVRVLPGDSAIFLASDGPINDSPNYYDKTFRKLNLNTVHFRPEILAHRLTEQKKNYLMKRIKEAPTPRLNYDYTPISYYFNITLWGKQFKSWEKNLLVSLASHSRLYLFYFPLFFIMILLIISLIRKSSSWPVGWPLFFLGFSTMAAEIGLLLAFQVNSGLVYGKISLLLSLFMFGLFLGSFLAKKFIPRGTPGHLAACQMAILIFLALANLSFRAGNEVYYYFLFVLMGIIGGITFIISNSIFLEKTARYGLGYAVDLSGSFVGAMMTSTFFIPLLGLKPLFTFLLLANFLCLAFVFLKNRLKFN